MVEPELEPEQGNYDSGFDPEEVFEEGRLVGQEDREAELVDETIDRLITEGGFDPEEAEAFFDPAPRRHRRGRRRGKVHCSARQRATMPQICKGGGGSRRSRRYDPDPAPRRHRRRRRGSRRYDPAPAATNGYKRKAKGWLPKIRKFAMPAAAGLSFYSAYTKRAAELKAANVMDDATPPALITTVYQAIMYDFKNFNTTAAVTRMKNQIGEIATPLIAGWAVKETKILGKFSGIAGDLLTGLGVGIAAKTILDPPVNSRSSSIQQQQAMIQAAQSTAKRPCPHGSPCGEQNTQPPATVIGYSGNGYNVLGGGY